MSSSNELSDPKAQLNGAKKRAAKRYQDYIFQTRRADHAEQNLAEEKGKREESEIKAMNSINSLKNTIAQFEKEKAEEQGAGAHGEHGKAHQADTAQLETECNMQEEEIAQLEAEEIHDHDIIEKFILNIKAEVARLRIQLGIMRVQGVQQTKAKDHVNKQVIAKTWKLTTDIQFDFLRTISDQKKRNDIEVQKLQDKCNQQEQKAATLQQQVHELNEEIERYKPQEQQQVHQSNKELEGCKPQEQQQAQSSALQENSRKDTTTQGFVPLAPRKDPVQAIDQGNKRKRLGVTEAFDTTTQKSKRSGSSPGSSDKTAVTRSSVDNHDAASTQGTKSQIKAHYMPKNPVTHQQEKIKPRQLRKILPSTQRLSPNQHSAMSLANGLDTLTTVRRSLFHQIKGDQKETTDVSKPLIKSNKASQARDQSEAQLSSSLEHDQGNGMQLMDRTDSHQDMPLFPSSLENNLQPSLCSEQHLNAAYATQIVQPFVPMQRAIPVEPSIIVQEISQIQNKELQMNIPEAHSDLSPFNMALAELPKHNPHMYQQRNDHGNDLSTPSQPMMSNGQMQISPPSANQFTNVQMVSPFSMVVVNPAQESVQNGIAPDWTLNTLGMDDPILASNQNQESLDFDMMGFGSWVDEYMLDPFLSGNWQQTDSFMEQQAIPTVHMQQFQQDLQMQNIDPTLIGIGNSNTPQTNMVNNHFPTLNTVSNPQLSGCSEQSYSSTPAHASLQQSQSDSSSTTPSQKRPLKSSNQAKPASSRSTPARRARPARSAPKPPGYRVPVACTHCHANWWNDTCNDGEPCMNCVLSGNETCERARCKDYAEGTCTKRLCSAVHENDDRYQHVTDSAPKLKRNGMRVEAKRSPVKLAGGMEAVLRNITV